MSRKKKFVRATSLTTTLLITLALVSGCSSAASDTQTESQPTQSTVVESQKETEVTEQETEPVTETQETQVTEETTEQVTEQSEVPKETEVAEQQEVPEETQKLEEEVLFRVSVSNPKGAFVTDKPSTSCNEYFFVEYGTEFDVYEVYENESESILEGKTVLFYRIKMEDGREEYIWSENTTKCE